VLDEAYAWTPENLNGVGHLMWDEENLYLALRVRDDVHHAMTDDQTAAGDSVVLALDPTNRSPEGSGKAFAYHLSSAQPGGGSGPHTIFRPEALAGGLRAGQLYKDSSVYEMAVAAAGSVLGIHPFNQPNVEMSKELARQMMNKSKKGNSVEEAAETVSVEDPEALSNALGNFLDYAQAGNYVAIQAYLPPTPETTEALQKIRLEILNRLRLATTLGYGPRFLHSTGQLHKGGANTGLFIQLIDEPTEDLAVPETDYTFGELIQAQASGDYLALKRLGRRVLRINLKKDIAQGLSRLSESIHQ